MIDLRKRANQSYDLEGLIPVQTDPISNVTVNPATLAYIRWAIDNAHAYAENIVQLREYYEGTQDSMLTDRQRKYLEVGHNVTFRLNAMPIPVDIMAERMRVIGFAVRDDKESDPQGGTDGALWRWWEASRMDGQQVMVHKAAARDGDTFAIVGWDEERGIPEIHPELAYDGRNGVIVRYRPDDRSRVWYAVKRWTIQNGPGAGDLSYMTLYTDDAIFNYIGATGQSSWRRLPDENGVWPTPWLRRDGSPMGVCVFHNANKADGTGQGKSELQDLIGAQNALDKVVIDELGIADSSGFPIVTIAGIKAGDVVLSPGSVLSSESEGARFGQIAAADLTQLSALVEKWITRIAQMSRTPINFFQVTGQVARADTQKAGDSPLVSKVRAQAVATGNFWEDVMGMCRRLHNEYSGGATYPENIISTQWDTFESIDVMEEDKQRADTQKVKAETFSQLLEDNPNADRFALAQLAGYTADEAAVLVAPSTGFIDDGLTQ